MPLVDLHVIHTEDSFEDFKQQCEYPKAISTMKF